MSGHLQTVCMCCVLHIDTCTESVEVHFMSMVSLTLGPTHYTTGHQSPAGLACSLLDAHGWSIPDLQGPELKS